MKNVSPTVTGGRENNMEENVEQTENKKDENTGTSASVEGKLYTQEELDALFGLRTKQSNSALLKKLGFENFEEAEALTKKAREADEASKSELQKAQERAAELEKRIEAEALERKEMATSHEVAMTANKLGIVDSDVAYRLIDKESIEYDDKGKPSNIEALLKKLVQDKPYLLGGNKPGAFNFGKGEGAVDPIIEAARKAAGLT